MAWGLAEPRFDICWMTEDAEPDSPYFEQPEDFTDDMVYEGKWVAWIGDPGTMMRVNRDMITAMPGNPFDPNHLAFLAQMIRNTPGMPVLPAPAARIHVLSAVHVEESQAAFEEDPDSFADSWGMTRPWEEEDIGEHFAVLLDGNHRAFAAICAGEPDVWVTVGPNYRDDVAEHLE